MRPEIVIALFLAACGPAAPRSATPPPSGASFRDAVRDGPDAYLALAAARLSALDGELEAAPTPDGIALTVATSPARGSRSLIVSLERPFGECEEHPRECDALTEDYLRSVVAAIARPESDASATPERLRLAVRDEASLAALGPSRPEVITQPLVGDLSAVVMVDFPESARYLSRAELAALGLDQAGAIDRARENVLAELGAWPIGADAVTPGSAGFLSSGYYYESSRLFDTAGLAALERASGAPLLLAVPTVDSMLVATTADPSAPMVIAELARRVAADSTSRPLSGLVLRFENGSLTLAH